MIIMSNIFWKILAFINLSPFLLLALFFILNFRALFEGEGIAGTSFLQGLLILFPSFLAGLFLVLFSHKRVLRILNVVLLIFVLGFIFWLIFTGAIS